MVVRRWLPVLLIASLVSSSAGSLAAEPVEPAAMAARVDAMLAAHWSEAGVEPAAPAGDAEFLRRAFLDLTGRIPPVSEVRAFMEDSGANHRESLIERLLARPNHATHLANTWREVMLPAGADLRQLGGAIGFQGWLRGQFADNAPYDRMTTELLLAGGNAGQVGPALYFTALQLKPEELAASTSRVLLGVQIACAQCHNHPFDHWTRDDFWGYAAFFARLQRPTNPQQRAFQVVDVDSGEVTIPGTDAVIPPKYLGGPPVTSEPEANRRELLARWITSAENPYFARATTNRVWAHMFGRGLVEPVDDLGPHNPPSHPELLDALADYFVRTDFDLRNLFRTLALTKAYQLSSATQSDGETDPELFARMAIKPLSPEQLYDCLIEATRRRAGTQGRAAFAGAAFYNQDRQAFLAKFQSSAQTTEFEAGIPQALTLMNGPLVAQATDPGQSDLLGALAAPFFSHDERVDVLFLSVLSRPPSSDERKRFVEYVRRGESAGNASKALGDVLWTLLNSAEFILNH